MSHVRQILSSRRSVRGVLPPLLLLLVWELVARCGSINKNLLVSPTTVLATTVTLTRQGELWAALQASLNRMLMGFVLGTAAGLLLGMLLGLSRTLSKLLGPSFHAVRQIAVFAWIPLISMWFGLGETAKVVFIGIVALFPVVLNTHEGIKSVSLEHIEVARVLTFNRLRLLRRVIFPAATPSIFTGIELAVMYAWLATIGAEYLMTTNGGIGSLMLEGREQFRMDVVLLGVIMTGLVGWILSSCARRLGTHLLRWRVTA